MKKFVIGHVSFFDNNLVLELIEAKSEGEARWQHSKLRGGELGGLLEGDGSHGCQ